MAGWLGVSLVLYPSSRSSAIQQLQGWRTCSNLASLDSNAAVSWPSVFVFCFAMSTAPRLPKTFALSALEKRDLDLPDLRSTVSFLDSCAKEETLPTTMELVENQFMGASLRMRTLSLCTLLLVSWVWPMLDPIPTDLNSLSVPRSPLGSMASTLSLDLLWKDWMSFVPSRRLDLPAVPLAPRLSSNLPDKSKWLFVS